MFPLLNDFEVNNSIWRSVLAKTANASGICAKYIFNSLILRLLYFRLLCKIWYVLFELELYIDLPNRLFEKIFENGSQTGHAFCMNVGSSGQAEYNIVIAFTDRALVHSGKYGILIIDKMRSQEDGVWLADKFDLTKIQESSFKWIRTQIANLRSGRRLDRRHLFRLSMIGFEVLLI